MVATSLNEQAQTEKKVTSSDLCEWCGGSGWVTVFHERPADDGLPVRWDQVTRFRWESEIPLIESLMVCPCTEHVNRQRRIDKMLGDPDIPRDAARFDFEDFDSPRYKAALPYARQMVDGIVIDQNGEEKPGLLFIGPTGTGKTTLAAIIFRHWVERGASAVWTDYTSFIKRIQESYNDSYQGPTRQQMILTVAEARYVVLDDLGAKVPGKSAVNPASADKVEIIYQVLSIREKRRLPTIITSNLEKQELYDHFESRIVSRIFGLCCGVYVGGDDYRVGGR